MVDAINMTSAELSQQFVVACTDGNKELVQELLLNPRVEVNSKDLHRTTPLMFAVMGGHLDVVHLLLGLPSVKTKPSHINSVSRNNKTALILACERGFHDIVNLLLYHPDIEPKANIHALHNGALRAAVRGQHDDCVRLLLRAGADVTSLLMNHHLTPRTNHNQSHSHISPRMQRMMQYGGRLCGNLLCQQTCWQAQPPTTSHANTISMTSQPLPSPSTTTASNVDASDTSIDSAIPTNTNTTALQQQSQPQQQQQQQPQPQEPPQQQSQSPLRTCSRCHITAYCSVACSKVHWKTHKNRCTPSPTSLG